LKVLGTVMEEHYMSRHAIWVTDAPAASDDHSLAMVGGGPLFIPSNGPHGPDSRKVVGETMAAQALKILVDNCVVAVMPS
jgi:hypothetical protein